MTGHALNSAPEKRGCLKTLGLMLLTVIISVAATVWFLNVYLFPKKFEPVQLDAAEIRQLDTKLVHFEGFTSSEPTKVEATSSDSGEFDSNGALRPQQYDETGANRTIELSEREVNALLAKNTDLADKLAVDLSDGLISAKLRLPMDPDFPFVGGKIIKGKGGISFSYAQGRPSVVIKGVSIMGIPVPNAWLGNLKNIDLVENFGESEGFWKQFADGVEHIEISDDKLVLELKP